MTQPRTLFDKIWDSHVVETQDDGWTVTTCDGKLSAQFEHTVAVTKTGVRVLTLRPGEKALN